LGEQKTGDLVEQLEGTNNILNRCLEEVQVFKNRGDSGVAPPSNGGC
jgi:hypothetical protein